jgi:hypothetical protein
MAMKKKTSKIVYTVPLITREKETDRTLFALVDEEDFQRVTRYKWYATKMKSWNDLSKTTYPAQTEVKGRKIAMHQLIKPAPEGFRIRHTNGNCLDNRKDNLEFIKQRERSGAGRATGHNEHEERMAG